MSNYQKTIGVDFDGVVHAYRKGWHDGTVYDGPVEGAIDALERLVKRGYKIVIFTCRAETPEGKKAVEDWLFRECRWFDEYGPMFSIEVTDKKPKAIAYIDDRGIRFTNWIDILNYF